MSGHQITAIPRPKMDTPTGLFTWECTCGRVGSMIGSEADALKAGENHRAAKEAAATHRDRRLSIMLTVSSPMLPASQIAIVQPGDTFRMMLTALLEGTEFRLVTVPVEIRASIA